MNPWAEPEDSEEDDGPDTSDWYSPEMQYSPPRIQFVPTAHEVVFAICEFPEGVGNIQLAQFPGKASKYQTTLDLGEGTYSVTIRSTGNIGDGLNVSCANGGDEFNPLFETDKYGNPNPFQDPSRGTIADIVVDVNGDGDIVPATDLLQNLTGKDGLLGRSIEISTEDGESACCVVARDETPAQFLPQESYPAQRHGYGGRGFYH